MELSKGQRNSAVIGVVSFVIPFIFYGGNRISGLLSSEVEWWSQGINHGPWRWEWQMLMVLPFIYFLLFGALAVALTGIYQGIMQKSFPQFAIYSAIAFGYLAMFYMQAHTLYWTID